MSRRSGRLSRNRRRLRRKNSHEAAVQTSTDSDDNALILLPVDDEEQNDLIQDSQNGQDCKSIVTNTIHMDQLSSDPSISLKPELSCATAAKIDIPPEKSTFKELSIAKQPSVSIPPRPVYPPAVLNAMFGKHPSHMTQEEVDKFKLYQQLKIRDGDSIEEDIVYQPIGGVRTCVQCGHLT